MKLLSAYQTDLMVKNNTNSSFPFIRVEITILAFKILQSTRKKQNDTGLGIPSRDVRG